jgi:hypothetical protein
MKLVHECGELVSNALVTKQWLYGRRSRSAPQPAIPSFLNNRPSTTNQLILKLLAKRGCRGDDRNDAIDPTRTDAATRAAIFL